jgi:hypothetical protein
MRIPSIDMISFWIGVAVASVFWWVGWLTRPLIGQLISSARERSRERQLQLSAGVEDTHRKIIYKQTQGMHIAASLFALDEIAESARLLAPPPQVEPGIPSQRPDAVEESLPYLPAWPELASVYRAQTLTIPQALSGGMNLILVGQPGAGKTVALAYLASQIVNRAPQVETLHEKIPFLIHVADLGLPLANAQKPQDLLAPIANLVAENAPVFDAGRMPTFVQYAFESGRALLLLDGVDELPRAAIQDVSDYLRVLLKSYAKTRVITTAGPEFADGLPGLGFAPLALMPWTANQQNHVLERWTELWQRYVAMEPWAQAATEPVDALLLNRWLLSDNFGLTPLEFTLKIWAAYAGDTRGAHATDAIDAHLRRLMPQDTPFEVLYVIGAQASLNGISIFDSKRAREWTKSFEPAEPAGTESAPVQTASVETEEPVEVVEPEALEAAKKGQKKGSQQAQTARSSLIGQLATSGILAAHSGNRLRFAHPIFMGFLAGKALGGPGPAETLLNQPAWSGQTTAMRYIAAFSDANALVNGLLTLDDPMLLRPKITAARLLRDAPRNAAWRASLMSALVAILQDEEQPQGLRGQMITAFALSGDPNVTALFRQLMMVPSAEMQRFAALGAGLLVDAKAVEGLADVLMKSMGRARQAACLALVQIGNPEALETVATALLRGDEQLRIAAAEALANHPTDGQEALREGIASEDILVRRAIVYGLARVDESWATEILEKVQIQDEQWVVRNAAVEILGDRQHIDPHIPRRLTTPSETPWLIEFAGKHGQGVTPGAPATDILLLAFKDENEDIRDAALNYLRYTPTDGVLSAFYQKFYSGDADAKESLYRAFSTIAYTGITLPPPMQFGVG